MQKYVEEALKLVNNAIMESEESITSLNEQDWCQIYNILRNNALVGMCYQYVQSNAEKLHIPSALLLDWKNESFTRGLKQMVMREELKQILHNAKQHNLSLILFKGVVLADIYKEPNMRLSSDTDILIRMEERAMVIPFFEENGYTCKPQKDHVDMLSKNGQFFIELHTSLWEDFTGKRIQQLENLALDAEEKLIPFYLGQEEAYTLGYTEHFIYQIYHIAKHFSFESIGLRYLLDIAKYYNTFQQNINISYFWYAMNKTGMQEFCKRLFDICIHYLSLNKTVMFGSEFILDTEERHKLIRLFLREEVTSKSRWDVIGVLRPYFCDERYIEPKPFLRYFNMIFPDNNQIEQQYYYVQKCKLLLPVAWIHRYVKYLKNRSSNRTKLDISEKLVKADSQIQKMKDMKMLDYRKTK